MSKVKTVKLSRTEELSARAANLAERARLDSWNSFVAELPVPADMAPALMANRPDLLKLVPKRALSAEEAAALITLVGGLMETNQALREHAEQTAQLVNNWMDNFRGLATVAGQIDAFANFRQHEPEPIEDQ